MFGKQLFRKVNPGVYIAALLMVGSTCVFAEEFPVSFGFKGGVPVTDWFNINNNNNAGSGTQYHFGSADRRYEFGPTAEFHLFHVRIEIDALYKRLGYDFSTSDPLGLNPASFNEVQANQWEFPGLVKYNIRLGHFRPYIEAGAVLRHLSTFRQTTESAGLGTPQITDNTAALHNRNSFGGVAGIGVTFKKGPLELSPEVRYTRWSNQAFESNPSLLKTNLDQGDVLFGISF